MKGEAEVKGAEKQLATFRDLEKPARLSTSLSLRLGLPKRKP